MAIPKGRTDNFTGATDATNDQPVSKGAEYKPTSGEISVMQEIHRCRMESWDAKQSRLWKNRVNNEAYLGRQSWSHKADGQSMEFIPKTGIAVEAMGNFIKRGLIKFGKWYSVDTDRALSNFVSGQQLSAILDNFLKNIWAGNNKTMPVELVISDALKMGLLNSVVILKVHGAMVPFRKFKFSPAEASFDRETGEMNAGEDTLDMEEDEKWQLRIDLVQPEDYYPDPTAANLYEIHRIEKDLFEVIDAAEQGIYDMKVVKQMIGTSFEIPDDERRSEADKNQSEFTPPGFRKKVVLDEFWGTLLNADGTVAHRNCVCTMANDTYLIRPPEPNPFWHQESPFICEPIIRVPWAVWGKALFDDAVALNLAQNELFNLILDGGMASVWGVKQIRVEDLEDPSQVEGGLRQGTTLAVKQTLPHNAKVVEECSTGDVPHDAMAVYEALDREYNTAVFTNDLKLGNMPSKQVRATEVIESSTSQSITLDGMAADVEVSIINRMLYKAWMCVLQNADYFDPSMVTSVTDRAVANIIMRASPEERFALFGGKTSFRTFGLSATIAKALDFQKMMALMQAVQSNPILFRAFMMKFSGDRALTTIMSKLNINPDDMQQSPEEQDQAPQAMQETMQIGQMLGMGGQGGAAAPGAEGGPGGMPVGGGSEVPAAINQNMNPTSGLTPNA